VAPTASSLALLYERNHISAQIAWDYTSDYTETSNAVAGLPSVVDSILWLTASASYAFTKDFSIFIEGSNLTDATYRSNLGRPDASYGFETWGRTVSFGATFTF
jgi:iron complex outermembrane recepter protein